MKTRELSMGEKQAIVTLRKEGKSIRGIAQTLGIANTTIWNVLKKNETTGVLSNRHRMGRPRKTRTADDRNMMMGSTDQTLLFTDYFDPMPPKREAGGAPSQSPAKMMKVSPETHSFGCDPVEESNYSPFPNHDNENIDFDEENVASSGIRTDTVSLLMKIEQLQAQLKYERRCRILAERELRELKEMNTLMMQMRHTAHELRVTLDHVLHGSEAEAAALSSQDEALSFLAEPEAPMGIVHNIAEDSQDFLYLAENLRVPKNLYERIAEIADYKKYTSALLMMLFDRETLATHSLQGRRSTFTGEDCHKPQLPPGILRSLIDHVADKFGVDSSQIKTAIRTKLNNEDKLLKKRLGLGKAESKAGIDQRSCQDAALLPENAAATDSLL